MQICDVEGIGKLEGAISKDHVHIHLEYAPKKNISDIVKKLKGKTSKVL